MLGVLVNTVAVLIGSTIGLLFKKGIPQKYSDAVMTGIALCTVYIGISGALKGENTIVLIVSMALGAALGTLMDLDSPTAHSVIRNATKNLAYTMVNSNAMNRIIIGYSMPRWQLVMFIVDGVAAAGLIAWLVTAIARRKKQKAA